jgi:hypothetical protein
MRIVPSQFKSLAYQVAANFNGDPLNPRITQLFGLLRLTRASVGAYGITAYSTPHERNRSTHGPRRDRGNLVSLVVSRALLLEYDHPGPSLLKASLVCCSPGRGEDEVHFSGLSANRKRSINGGASTDALVSHPIFARHHGIDTL